MEPLMAVRARDDLDFERAPLVDVRGLVGYIALAVFVVTGTTFGFLCGVKWGFLALSLSSLVAAYLLGAE